MGIRSVALIKACHPEPTVAVTVLSTVLFINAGNPAGTCVLGALAVLTGQLSIGWSNDLIDRERDLTSQRQDKPLVAGSIRATDLRAGCLVAIASTVGFSLALGWIPGLLHVAAVAAGWAYNVRLKVTALSVLPYCFAFGALPIIATESLPDPHLPPMLVVLAAALIGAAAHYANVLPDIADDLATGVRGLPQRIGFRAAAAAAAVATLLATALVLALRPGWPTLAGLLAVLVVLAAAAWAARTGRARVVFSGIVLCAAIDVGLIVARGGLS